MEVFKKLKQFYWPYRWYFFFSIISLVFVAGITVIYPIVLQITIDDVVAKERFQLVPYIAHIFVGLMVVKSIATYFNQYLGDLFGISSVYAVRD